MSTGLRIRDFRVFSGSHQINLKPLTLIIGENSSGKTSLIAAYRAALDMSHGSAPTFNKEPFRFGSYGEIAHKPRVKTNQPLSFEIGLSVPELMPRGFFGDNYSFEKGALFELSCTFVQGISEPIPQEVKLSFDNNTFLAKMKNDTLTCLITTNNRRKPYKFSQNDKYFTIGQSPAEVAIDDLLFAARRYFYSRMGTKKSSNRDEYFSQILGMIHDAYWTWQRSVSKPPFCSAPIRFRPRRTYNPTSDIQVSEGGHVPMQLARLHYEHINARTNKSKTEWSNLKKALEEFGRNAGLFRSLAVRRLGGNSGGNPFQLKANASGRFANLIDLGYGVSQALPILVDVLMERVSRHFLFQQPEVHLHPRAQAELASFFVTQKKAMGHNFLIETHSDYIIDRLRIHVRDKDISAKDVNILYLETINGEVKVHEIELDKMGNLINAPSSYRDFFVQEDRRFLGF